MTIKVFQFLALFAYAIIASQAFMYILSFKEMQLGLDVSSYINVRKLIDSAMRANFRFVIYAALLSTILLVFSQIKNPSGVLFICSSVALIALIADIILTLKGSLPINDIINTWTPAQYPANWTEYREKWFAIFQYRQVLNIIGFVSLLVGTVFGGKQPDL